MKFSEPTISTYQIKKHTKIDNVSHLEGDRPIIARLNNILRVSYIIERKVGLSRWRRFVLAIKPREAGNPVSENEQGLKLIRAYFDGNRWKDGRIDGTRIKPWIPFIYIYIPLLCFSPRRLTFDPRHPYPLCLRRGHSLRVTASG